MTDTVNIYGAKTNLSKLADRAAADEEIIIAKASKPKAKLEPTGPGKKAPWRTESAGNCLHRRGFRCSAAS